MISISGAIVWKINQNRFGHFQRLCFRVQSLALDLAYLMASIAKTLSALTDKGYVLF
jgi:hypothetical protein